MKTRSQIQKKQAMPPPLVADTSSEVAAPDPARSRIKGTPALSDLNTLPLHSLHRPSLSTSTARSVQNWLSTHSTSASTRLLQRRARAAQASLSNVIPKSGFLGPGPSRLRYSQVYDFDEEDTNDGDEDELANTLESASLTGTALNATDARTLLDSSPSARRARSRKRTAPDSGFSPSRRPTSKHQSVVSSPVSLPSLTSASSISFSSSLASEPFTFHVPMTVSDPLSKPAAEDEKKTPTLRFIDAETGDQDGQSLREIHKPSEATVASQRQHALQQSRNHTIPRRPLSSTSRLSNQSSCLHTSHRPMPSRTNAYSSAQTQSGISRFPTMSNACTSDAGSSKERLSTAHRTARPAEPSIHFHASDHMRRPSLQKSRSMPALHLENSRRTSSAPSPLAFSRSRPPVSPTHSAPLSATAAILKQEAMKYAAAPDAAKGLRDGGISSPLNAQLPTPPTDTEDEDKSLGEDDTEAGRETGAEAKTIRLKLPTAEQQRAALITTPLTPMRLFYCRFKGTADMEEARAVEPALLAVQRKGRRRLLKGE